MIIILSINIILNIDVMNPLTSTKLEKYLIIG